jgi:hypothetical protein
MNVYSTDHFYIIYYHSAPYRPTERPPLVGEVSANFGQFAVLWIVFEIDPVMGRIGYLYDIVPKGFKLPI